MFQNWINSIICDHSKTLLTWVISWITGMMLYFTNALVNVFETPLNPTVVSNITTFLMWTSFSCGIAVSVLSLISKCRQWSIKRKHKKQRDYTGMSYDDN